MKMYFENSEQLIRDLIKWWKQEQIKKDQEMLSRFMKDSKEGKLSDETLKWWMNRY